jgi:GDPmannose 4,6-dehydratase
VETLLGDATKAKEKLGWTPRTSFLNIVSEMVAADYDCAVRDRMLNTHGYSIKVYNE